MCPNLCKSWPVFYQKGNRDLKKVTEPWLRAVWAGVLWGAFKTQTQCIFPIGFLLDALHTQMCLHWQNKEPEEWLCQIL